ncbi:MAG: hypothetical protein J6S50_01750 [Oscillospiraceae bacterium]|nr:hypothetical protein [Oscillospiraceae bacterium]
MNKYVPIGKRSKAAQKEFYSSQRSTWNGLNPVTRTVKNGKSYDRNRQKQEFRRNSRDYQNGTPAVFCLSFNKLQSMMNTVCSSVELRS